FRHLDPAQCPKMSQHVPLYRIISIGHATPRTKAQPSSTRPWQNEPTNLGVPLAYSASWWSACTATFPDNSRFFTNAQKSPAHLPQPHILPFNFPPARYP